MKKIFVILFFLLMFNFTNAGSIETTFANKTQVEKNKILMDSNFTKLSKKEKIEIIRSLINEIQLKIEKILLEKKNHEGYKADEFIVKDGFKYYRKQYTKNQKLLYCNSIWKGVGRLKINNDSKYISIKSGEEDLYIEERTSKKTQTYLILKGLGINGKVKCLNDKKQVLIDWRVESFTPKLIENYEFKTKLTKDNLLVDVYDKRTGKKIQTIVQERNKVITSSEGGAIAFAQNAYDTNIVDWEKGIYKKVSKNDIVKSINLNFDENADLFLYSKSTIAGDDAYYGYYYIFSQKDNKFIRARELDGVSINHIKRDYMDEVLTVETFSSTPEVIKALAYDDNGVLKFQVLNNFSFKTKVTKDALEVEVYDRVAHKNIQTIIEKKNKHIYSLRQGDKDKYYTDFTPKAYTDIFGYEYDGNKIEDNDKNHEKMIFEVEFIKTKRPWSEYLDLNNDGIQDIFIQKSSDVAGEGEIYGSYYIYSQEDKKFVKAEDMEGVGFYYGFEVGDDSVVIYKHRYDKSDKEIKIVYDKKNGKVISKKVYTISK